MFKKVMILAAVTSGIAAAITVGVYCLFPLPFLETFAITLGTIFYHFAMRLCVGAAWSPFQNHNPNSAWFRQKPFEKRLYAALGVKKWKGCMPTYNPASFDITIRTPDEIKQAMCHSELVHETIVVLSFLPLFAAIPFGAFPAFLITSLLAATFDTMFIIMQRYNRPRMIILAKRYQKTLSRSV